MSYNYLPLDRKPLNFQQVKNLLDYQQLVSITFDAHEKILQCRQYLDNKLNSGSELYYGINTGLGNLQEVQIDKSQIAELQYNLLKSHACGLGEEVPVDIVKLMLMFKIKSLSYGYSGISIETVKRLMEMYNNNVIPVIYNQGSLGASGDLAPLCHLSLPLIGLGEVHYKGKKVSSSQVLDELNWQPLQLQSKEGLALINGTQFMSAYGLFSLKKAEQLIKMSDAIAALSFDAFDCSLQPLHERIHSIRSFKGQVDTATTIKKYLKGSEIINLQKRYIHDPYSFMCLPQVHGATKDTFNYVLSVFLKEINSVTDSPNIFPEDDLILSGGNFHGLPLALALDFLSIAMSGLANISERRTHQLISGERQLPMFLVKNPGLHYGFMISQYTAAGLVSENKQLCTPSSIDSISGSNNQEDHVSMGANAAVKCLRLIDNVEKVLAIELLTAAQALEFRRPLKSSPFVEQMVSDFRQKVSFSEEDRVMRDDMVKAIAFVGSYSLNQD